MTGITRVCVLQFPTVLTCIDVTFATRRNSLNPSPASVLYMADNNPSDYPPEVLAYLSPYNYVPTEYVCAIFVALYGLSTCRLISLAIANIHDDSRPSNSCRPINPLPNVVAAANRCPCWSG